MIDINEYSIQKECEYKDEKYLVRDNGAILRKRRKDARVRSKDDKWTFGKEDCKTKYLLFVTNRVHRIVATAFHGPAPIEKYVVDHIDTNRQNNRPDNLRWVTKFENICLNHITRKN